MIYDLQMFQSEIQRKLWAKAYDTIVQKNVKEGLGNKDSFSQFLSEKWNYYHFPEDDADHLSSLPENLKWMTQSGFSEVECYFLEAGHALYGGSKLKK